ncbi:MAG TPA: hypothetical protein PK890_05540 [Terrimesophilobacter sp.]|nr:hypothetical protein [Terrimesophilobacter sp.]
MAKNKGDKNRDDSGENSGEVHADGEPVVRDKRRIDPETGDVREVADEPSGSDEVHDLDDELQRLLDGEVQAAATDASASESASEHLADLKRIQAEYANYRKRVERDRSLARELALA